MFDRPRTLGLRSLSLTPPKDGDAVVDIEWSGISTGTERLLWEGRMPEFPGMGYPLVPGYEGVGVVLESRGDAVRPGDRVFVPGSSGFVGARGLFGASARRVVTRADRLVPLGDGAPGAQACLFALAATALHAVRQDGLPELVVGHGVLGRLVARLVVALGGVPPRVWELEPSRRGDARGYPVMHPDEDERRDYVRICDVSGDSGILDHLMPRLARHGVITLAGFYSEPLRFLFPPAFQREAQIRVAAEWTPDDLDSIRLMVDEGRIDLGGLISHTSLVETAGEAYERAFEDSDCLKMILDWRNTE